MLILEDAILINRFGQNLIGIEHMIKLFSSFNVEMKRDFLREINSLIMQSKPILNDIEPAILSSGLKPTYTPCILLRKGITRHNLEKLVLLPENELSKVYVLLLSLFIIAYKRRYSIEKNNPNKWWYWDLSDNNNINNIIKANQ